MEISFSKPQKCAVKVPVGRILVNNRWHGSLVCKELDTTDCRVSFSDGLGFVDFFPSDLCPVLYFTEAELLTPKSFRERVQLLSKEYNHCGVILVDICRSSGYQELLDLACIDCELTVFPVSNQNEISRILRALAYAETRPTNNPFKSDLSSPESEIGKQQISILRQIPKIGEKTAMKLLQSFGHISSISKLSEERLAIKVGKSDAKKVYQYFRTTVSL